MLYGKDILDNCVLSNKDNFEASKVVDYLNADRYFVKATTEDLKKGIPGTMVGNFSDGDKRTYLFANYSHTLVIGGTGSGKTEGYFIPAIDAYAESEQNNSLFIMDLKGVTYAKTAEKLKRKGYKIYVLNFKDPFSSMRFNPLSGIYRRYRKAQELKAEAENDVCSFNGKSYPSPAVRKNVVMRESNILMADCENDLAKVSEILCPLEGHKDLTWDYGSRDIIFSALYGLLEDSNFPQVGMTEEKYNFYNLFNLLYTSEGDNTYILNWIRNHPSTSKCRRMLSYYEMRAQQTKDCYINNTLNKLNRYNNLPTHVLTSVSDMDPEQIAADADGEKIAVYCLTDESYSITYALCLMFINRLLSALQRHRDKTGNVKAPFIFMLDEFANMPELPAVEKWISTLRSRNIWLHLGLQSYAQLNARYGDKKARIILDNCDTQIFFGSNNTETVNYFCSSLGKTCKAVCALNLDNNGRISSSVQPQNLPLVRLSDLNELKQGYAYVKCFRKPVLFTKTDLFFTYCPDPLPPETEKFFPEKETDLTENRYDIRNFPSNTLKRIYDCEKNNSRFFKPSVETETQTSAIKKENKAPSPNLETPSEKKKSSKTSKAESPDIDKKDSNESGKKSPDFLNALRSLVELLNAKADETEKEKEEKTESEKNKKEDEKKKRDTEEEALEEEDLEEEDEFDEFDLISDEFGSPAKDFRAHMSRFSKNSPSKKNVRVFFPSPLSLPTFFKEYTSHKRTEIKDPASKMENIIKNVPDTYVPVLAEYSFTDYGVLGLFELRPVTEVALALVKQGVLSSQGHYLETISVLDDEALIKKLLAFLEEITFDDKELVVSVEKARPNIAKFLLKNGFKEFEYKGDVPSELRFFIIKGN